MIFYLVIFSNFSAYTKVYAHRKPYLLMISYRVYLGIFNRMCSKKVQKHFDFQKKKKRT